MIGDILVALFVWFVVLPAALYFVGLPLLKLVLWIVFGPIPKVNR